MTGPVLERVFGPEFIERQIQHLIPDGAELGDGIRVHFDLAIADVLDSLRALKFMRGRGFDYLVSWHHSALLYRLSRRIWLEGGYTDLPVRLFTLNKAMHGLDLFYEIDMPARYCIAHTVGTVFAKADYGDHLIVHQHCTVGRQGELRPILEDGVVMFPGSSIIGRCHIKENTVLSAGVHLVNTSTPGHCYVFQGKSGRPVFKELNKYFVDDYYDRGTTADSVTGSL